MRKFLLALALLTAIPFVFSSSAVIYKSESCGHCTPYIESLFPVLERNGFQAQDIQVKDFINDPQARSEVAEINSRFGVPLEMQGHMLTLLDGKYLLEGHVQTEVLERFLKNDQGKADKIVLAQDSMDPNPPFYLLLAKDGSVKQCSSTQSIPECGESSSGNGTESLLKFKLSSNILVLGLLGVVFMVLVLLQLRVLK